MRKKAPSFSSCFVLFVSLVAWSFVILLFFHGQRKNVLLKHENEDLQASLRILRTTVLSKKLLPLPIPAPTLEIDFSIPLLPLPIHAPTLESDFSIPALTNASAAALDGVAVMCCLDGPGWLQRRYSMSVLNMYNGLPANYKVQIFHKGSVQALKGLDRNPGLRRLIDSGEVLVTELKGDWKKRTRSEIFLSLHFWSAVRADRVLFFGQGGALCHNSPFTLGNFTTDFDVVASPDGGFSLLKRLQVRDWLKSRLPGEDEYIKKIHGPLPYLLGGLKRHPGVKYAPEKVVNNFVLNPRDNATAEIIPWAISGTLEHSSDERRKIAIESCPEIKMIFPSLDHPGCFGASNTLDRAACIGSLCVSKTTGGC